MRVHASASSNFISSGTHPQLPLKGRTSGHTYPAESECRIRPADNPPRRLRRRVFHIHAGTRSRCFGPDRRISALLYSPARSRAISSALSAFGTYTVHMSASISRNPFAVLWNVQARSLLRICFASSASSPFTQSKPLEICPNGRTSIDFFKFLHNFRRRLALLRHGSRKFAFRLKNMHNAFRSASSALAVAAPCGLQNAVQTRQFAPNGREIDVHARFHQTG